MSRFSVWFSVNKEGMLGDAVMIGGCASIACMFTNMHKLLAKRAYAVSFRRNDAAIHGLGGCS